MSEPEKFQGGQRVLGCLSKVVLLVLILFLAFMALAGGVGSGQIDAGLAIAFGWISFLHRTVPQISWNWDLVGMSALCVVFIALLVHYLAGWMVTSVASKSGRVWNWPWRWTWGGLAVLGLMFLVGMSVGGVVHQIGWLAGSQESWFERRPRFLEERVQMRELDVEFRIALAETNTVSGVRQSFRDSHVETRSIERRKHSLLNVFHILLVSTNGTQVDGVILFPRHPEIKSRLSGYYVTEDKSSPVDAKGLSEFLKERGPFLLAL